MALIGKRILRFKGILTTDGAGAASTAITVPTGYKLLKVSLNTNGDGGATPLTGGTLIARDNGGAGTTHATVTATGAGEAVEKTFNATAVVSTLNIVVAGGGATKKASYAVWLQRTRAH